MKISKLFVGTIAVVSCVSCSTMTYTMSDSRSIEPVQNVMITPVVADMQVSDQKVQLTETLPIRLKSVENLDFTVREYKERLIAKVLKTNNSDVLIGTLVEVTTNGDGFLVMTVTGYPAKYVNFRSATEADQWKVGTLSSLNGETRVLMNVEAEQVAPIYTLKHEKEK